MEEALLELISAAPAAARVLIDLLEADDAALSLEAAKAILDLVYRGQLSRLDE